MSMFSPYDDEEDGLAVFQRYAISCIVVEEHASIHMRLACTSEARVFIHSAFIPHDHERF